MSKKNSFVEQSLITRIQELMQKAKDFRDLIQSAKTSTKKEYFKKKLRKNNEEAMQMLISLNRVKQSKEKNIQA